MLKYQFVLPGKKILWKILNALSKSVAAKTPTIAGRDTAPIAEQSEAGILPNLNDCHFNFLFNIVIITRVIDDAIIAKISSKNKNLQSLK